MRAHEREIPGRTTHAPAQHRERQWRRIRERCGSIPDRLQPKLGTVAEAIWAGKRAPASQKGRKTWGHRCVGVGKKSVQRWRKFGGKESGEATNPAGAYETRCSSRVFRLVAQCLLGAARAGHLVGPQSSSRACNPPSEGPHRRADGATCARANRNSIRRLCNCRVRG